jgi:hypothetical protein
VSAWLSREYLFIAQSRPRPDWEKCTDLAELELELLWLVPSPMPKPTATAMNRTASSGPTISQNFLTRIPQMVDPPGLNFSEALGPMVPTCEGAQTDWGAWGGEPAYGV